VIELLIGAAGIAFAAWMIIGARKRHRAPPPSGDTGAGKD
jgi:hypothetical protein